LLLRAVRKRKKHRTNKSRFNTNRKDKSKHGCAKRVLCSSVDGATRRGRDHLSAPPQKLFKKALGGSVVRTRMSRRGSLQSIRPPVKSLSNDWLFSLFPVFFVRLMSSFCVHAACPGEKVSRQTPCRNAC
jgi:hypothetical protein